MAGHVANLRGGAVEREAAFAELFRLSAEHSACGGSTDFAREAVACALPLCAVLCKPVSEVGAEEWRRGAQLLTALSGVDPIRVGAECHKLGQFPRQEDNLVDGIYTVWTQPDSALGVMLAKDPADLTHEDALLAAFAKGPWLVQVSTMTGSDAVTQLAGITTAENAGMFLPSFFLLSTATPSDDRNLVLLPLAMELLAQPEKLPEFALGGVLFLISQGVQGRPAVGARLLEAGDPIGVLLAVMRQVSPGDLIATASYAHASGGHGAGLWSVKELVESAQAGGQDLTEHLLSCGYVDLLLSVLNSVEQVGATNVHGFYVVFGIGQFLQMLNGSALAQVYDKLRAASDALHYLHDSEISFIRDFGMTASTMATIVAANLYGKEEDNSSFGFSQPDIDGFLALDIELLRCESYGGVWQLATNRCRGLLSFCISDCSKALLLNSSGAKFIPHLIDGLLLDVEHPRKDTADEIKHAVQRDHAECIQQISLFPPGCEALKESDVVAALDELVKRAWTEEAKDSARGALMQLTDRHREVAVEVDPDALHVMMSCE